MPATSSGLVSLRTEHEAGLGVLGVPPRSAAAAESTTLPTPRRAGRDPLRDRLDRFGLGIELGHEQDG